MTLPPNLITNRTARLPGDWKQHPVPATSSGRKQHTPGRMNKREAAYSLELEARRRAGEIAAWAFEAITLKVAEKPEGTKMKAVRYTPDFMVICNDGTVEFHEVKGYAEGDWIVKWKAVVERYPWFRFVLVDK